MLKDEGDHCLDVVHHDGLSVELSLIGGLVLSTVLFGPYTLAIAVSTRAVAAWAWAVAASVAAMASVAVC